MNTNKTTPKTWMWMAGVIGLGALGYFYWSGTITPPSAGLSSADATDAVGSQVLDLLNQIQTLHIDTTLFTDPGYQTLRDFSVAIPPVSVGRPNPFAPLPGVPLQPTSGH